MFITLQLPFVDLRRFLRYPPNFVPNRQRNGNPGILDFENIAANEYLRFFGHYRLRTYVPKFKVRHVDESDTEDQWRILKLNDIWQEEYLYASTCRGLRFENLEKENIAKGKLSHPRVKIRALRFSPFDPSNNLWSPCVRMETGILFDVLKPLQDRELISALDEFLKLKVNVPKYERNGAGSTAIINRQMSKGGLLQQHATLAKLIVNGTVAQNVLRLHDNMILPGEALLSVHYSANEIQELPYNAISLPRKLTRDLRISFLTLQNPRIGVWMFEVPELYLRKKALAKKRETIRNNTIAIMRYWAELQAIIQLRSAVVNNSFEFLLKENEQLQDYVNNATRFLLSGSWHGADLDIIRNIINAHQLISPDRQLAVNEALKGFKRQIAEKLASIGIPLNNIFVSYSHRDKEFLPYIKGALEKIYKSYQVSYFDDTDISAGDEWERKIKDSLDNASVAILLISANFLQSKYIKTNELPIIEDRYRRGKLNIIPILVEGELLMKGFLGGLQFLNGNNPLSECSEEQKLDFMEKMTEKVLSFNK